MRITFLLPHAGHKPSGGFKVVYEYANRLAARGHKLQLVHCVTPAIPDSRNTQFRCMVRYWQHRLAQTYRPDKWFSLHSDVHVLWFPYLSKDRIPDADVIVATAWQTAEHVATLDQAKGSKLYLIQGKETWSAADDRVMATWKLPLQKVVISQWLRQIAREVGEEALYIPNGLDFEVFGIDVQPEERVQEHIAMLYHRYPWKGSDDGLSALMLAKEKVPQLHATVFGVGDKPNVPSWITYHQNPVQPNLRRIYNQAAIFVAPSRTEGWGLTASEAMSCGAALAATDIGGHREFATHNKTALLSPAGDPASLAANIETLVKNKRLRLRIAYAGNSHIQQFTWDNSVTKFEDLLFKVVNCECQ